MLYVLLLRCPGCPCAPPHTAPADAAAGDDDDPDDDDDDAAYIIIS